MTSKSMRTLLCTMLVSATLVAQDPGRNLNAYKKAVKGNDIKTVKSYVNDPAFGANVKFSDGSTPLHWAAHAGQNTMTKYLLKHGADANAQTSTGTPLHWSVNNGKHDTTKTLIDRDNANPNAKITSSGLTPLHLAAGAGKKPCEGLAKHLIKRGSSVNERDKEDNTATHHAARKGNKDMLKLLVKHGAQYQAKNNKGETPLDLAKYYPKANEYLKELAEKDRT